MPDRPRDRERERERERERDRDRDRDRDRFDSGRDTSKRNSITDRLRNSFHQARRESPGGSGGGLQRRASTAPKGSPIPRIREWLDTCNAEHEHHCTIGSDTEVTTWQPVWLLDSVERRLVNSKPGDRYLALSYVWGASMRRSAAQPPTQLLMSNLQAFQESIPDADIPQTFQDAMWLARKLGLRYIWIDRLCIVQDDQADVDNHARHMAFVFANAYLTIVAAFGDAQTGLVSLNPKRTPRAIRSPGHQELVASSKWNTRAWTLVEHRYSRRCIYFFEDTVTWQCHCETWNGNPLGVMKKLRGNRHDCAKEVLSATFAFRHAPWPDLEDYAKLARDYSSRQLGTVDDSLRAFSGITHVLSRLFPGGFVFGMPLMFLDIALLWRPHACIRRKALSKPPYPPSWSWMGWWFDDIPVDLELWRAAADYVEETKSGRRGADAKRDRPSPAFKIRPTVTWSLTDRVTTVPVQNTGLQYRDLRSRRASTNELPPGWKRSGSYYKYDSDEGTLFKYPIPVEEAPEPGEMEQPTGDLAFPGPLLSFKTTAGLFDVNFYSTLAHRDRANPPIALGNIWGKGNRWIGQFRAHDAWLGIQSSNYDGGEKLEFIAISSATERRGSYVFSEDRFEEHMDADEIIDIVNVLWIERIGDIAFRRGIGHILLKAWEAGAKDEVGILLG